MDIKVSTSIVLDPVVRRKAKSILAKREETLSGFFNKCLEKLIKENGLKGGKD